MLDPVNPLHRFNRENADLVRDEDPYRYLYHVHISLRHKFIYFETPKVACSTIKASLQRFEVDDPNFLLCDDYLHDRSYSPLLNPIQVGSFRKLREDRRFFTFCFVRNPYTRLLSAYLDKIVRNKPEKRSIMRAVDGPEKEFLDYLSFEKFVSAVECQRDVDMDPHWRAQHSHLKINAFRFDFIGFFEVLARDLSIVAEVIGAESGCFMVSKRQERTNADAMVSMYYTEELTQRVRSLYKGDFEAFGYSERLEDALLYPCGYQRLATSNGPTQTRG